MQIRINQSNVVLTPKLKKHIESRVALAFGRFTERIKLVVVKFCKVKPNGGAPESRCRIEVTLNKKVRVEAADRDEFAAVDRALGHAARSISQVLEDEAAAASPLAAGI